MSAAVYFYNNVAYQVTPPTAAEQVSVTLTDGIGVVASDAIHLFGDNATLHFSAPGFISRTVEIDATNNAELLLIEMMAEPLPVVVTPPPVIVGAIDINSEPVGATVEIDGDDKGVTPIKISSLTGGAHRLRISLPGYQTIEEEITVTDEHKNFTRDYRLKTKQTTVQIRATPSGGILRVNGVVTDAKSLSLTSGQTHILRYQKTGYLAQTRELKVTANESSPIVFNLAEETGEVVIRSTPPANININGNINGEWIGVTPQTIKLQTVPQKITLTRDGYRGVELKITPTADASSLIDQTLQTEAAARLAEAQAQPQITVTAGITLKFFDPRRATFSIGASTDDKARRANEFRRQIRLTKPFYVSTTEITAAQFAKFRAIKNADKKPVRNVSWHDAAAFCNWLSAQQNLRAAYQISDGKVRAFDASADGYRLPSEAEWEWLARLAGRAKSSRFVWGDAATIPAGSGNFADESARGSVAKFIPRYDDGFAAVAPVASFVADAAGLYDMAGNVSEWVHDVYDLRPPSGAVETDPFGVQGDAIGDAHVVKGASFRTASLTGLRASFREGLLRGRDDVGFRVVRNLYEE